LDKLLPITKDWMKKNGDCNCETVQDVLDQLYKKNNEKLVSAIQAGINAANKKAPSQAQKIQKWVLLPKDFSVHCGELGPTLKLKRQIVYERYSSTIASLYDV